MALEYSLHADREFNVEELLAFFAAQLPDAVPSGPPGGEYLTLPGLQVRPYRDPPEPGIRAVYVDQVGFDRRSLVVYRMNPQITGSEEMLFYRQMIASTRAFFTETGSDGLLVHNGEYVIVEARDGTVALNREWDDELFTQPWLADVVAGLPRRTLAQPFL